MLTATSLTYLGMGRYEAFNGYEIVHARGGATVHRRAWTVTCHGTLIATFNTKDDAWHYLTEIAR